VTARLAGRKKVKPGARLFVATPSRVSAPLRQALHGAAGLRRVPVLDAPGLDGRALDQGSLVLCADASGIDPAGVGPSVVVLGDPDDAAGTVRDWLGIEGRDAVVFASRCHAFAAALGAEGGAEVLAEAEIRAHPEAALLRILSALDLTLEPGEARLTIERFEAALAASDVALTAQEERAWGRQALAIYRLGADEEARSSWCPRELFRWGDKPSEPPPRLMDITGGARTLVFGPYLMMPAGTWRATAVFDLDEEGAKRFFLASFGSSGEFSHDKSHPMAVGRNRMSVVHRFARPGPAEFILGVPHAAFHGTLSFSGLAIERADPSEAPAGPG